VVGWHYSSVLLALYLQEEAQKYVKVKKRKTEQPRNKPSRHRPKH
jgi:hypothetical protein